jgi:hypothetical protein
MRKDAKWYSNACRMAHSRGESPNAKRTRRANRDGNGVRIYVAPGDTIDDLVRKANAAMERELARRGVSA